MFKYSLVPITCFAYFQMFTWKTFSYQTEDEASRIALHTDLCAVDI